MVLNKKIDEYVSRADVLRKNERAAVVSVVSYSQIRVREIAEDSVGHSYENIFKDVLNDKIKSVTVEEPYMEANHQVCINFSAVL